jgi:hypothetical protein
MNRRSLIGVNYRLIAGAGQLRLSANDLATLVIGNW